MAATTYPDWLAGARITASQLNAMLPLVIVKPADETVTSSTTLQADNDLSCPVAANASYDFDCYLDYEGLIWSSSSGGIKFEWTVPAGATMRFWLAGLNTGGNDTASSTFLDSTAYSLGGRGAGLLCAVQMHGSLVTSSTAGNLALEWAQNFSSSTSTIVHAQSKLSLKRTA